MELITLFIAEKPPIPNSSLPVLLYRQLKPDNADFAALFAQNGYTGIWTNGIYSFHHFHTTAHEALGCISGWANVLLGGPKGQEVKIECGDAVLLPAGIGHKLLKASADFSIVGAYPPGQSPDLERGDSKRYEIVLAKINALPLPGTDPVTGQVGAVHTHWYKKEQ